MLAHVGIVSSSAYSSFLVAFENVILSEVGKRKLYILVTMNKVVNYILDSNVVPRC